MNAPQDHELEALLNAMADGLLGEEEERKLAAILKESGHARNVYRNWMGLHSALIWDYAAAATAVVPVVGPERSRIPLYAIAAMLAVLIPMAALFFYKHDPGSTVAEISSARGAVSWSAGNGEIKPLAAGSRVGAGTILVEGESSSAQFQFKDGTLVTLNGPTRLDVSETDRKRMILEQGVISARVAKQPAGKPLVIRTSMAELEVLGTEFVVSSTAGETSLEVKTGKVSLRRFIDGQSVVVGTGQTVAASLATAVMTASAPAVASPEWSISFQTEPPSSVIGRWSAPGGGQPGRMAAVPFIAGRQNDNKPVVHHAVGLPARVGRKSYVSLDESSVLRFRYRQKQRTGLKCFISCKRAGGGFGGNYEITLPMASSPEGADVWRSVETPLARMESVQPGDNPPIGKLEVTLLLIHSYETDSGLEISDISISGQSPPR